MNSRFVSECIRSNDGFIYLHLFAGQLAEQLTRPIQLFRSRSRRDVVVSLSRIQRHHDLFQSSISGPLSDSVDRTLDLTRSIFDGCKAVRYGETKVIVAMRTNRDAIRILEALSQRSNQLPILGRSLITDRVRNVHDRGAGIYDRIEYRAQVIDFSPSGIFRRKLHFVAKLSSALDSLDGNVESFASCLIEFVFQVNVTGSKKGVDARASSVFERLPAAVDIGGQGPCEPGNGN